MPGRATAVKNGSELESAVADLGRELGLEVRRQVKVGRRLWGAERFIDVVLTHKESTRSIGLECRYQGGSGTAEEKIPAIIQDISVWPIPGLVVFAGDGFSTHMRSYLHSTGKAVAWADLEGWLRLFFGLLRLPMVNRRRVALSRPLLASRHSRGLDFWREISARDSTGRVGLF